MLLQSSLGVVHPDTTNCLLNLSVVLESRNVNASGEDVHFRGDALMRMLPTMAMTPQMPNKEVMGYSGEFVSKPTGVPYPNAPYMVGSGLQGLFVS